MPNFTKSLPELFETVSKTKEREEKLSLLRNFPNQQVLQTICQGAYNENMVWALPEGVPPYKKASEPYGMCPSMLEREIRKLLYMLQGHPRMTPERTRREKIFIDMLEVLHPTEAEIIIQMKEGELIGVPHDLVHEAWTGLVTEPPAPKEPAKATKKSATKKKKKKSPSSKDKKA